MTMKWNLLVTGAAVAAISACGGTSTPEPEETRATSEPAMTTNQLLEDWDTPFGVPPFDRIAS